MLSGRIAGRIVAPGVAERDQPRAPGAPVHVSGVLAALLEGGTLSDDAQQAIRAGIAGDTNANSHARRVGSGGA